MSKKTITLSSNSSWYLFNFRRSTIEAFLRKNFNVICICPADSYTDALKKLGCEWYEIKVSRKGINPFEDFKLFLQILFLYLKIKPVAAFHFTVKNNIYGSFAAFFARVPAINNITGLGTAFLHRNFISRVVLSLYKLSQPLAHKVFCQNIEDLNLLAQFKILSKEDIGLLPGSGVNLDRFNPMLKKSLIDHKRKFRFLYAGRMLADKGLYELYEAISIMNNPKITCELWLSGFTDYENVSAIPKSTLEKWSDNSWILWKGPSDSIEKIMSEVDCIVLPSYREGMPKTLLEAGAMAIPVVTTDVPGCNSIITNNKNGLICKPKDSKSLGLALKKMLNMTNAERLEMGECGRVIVQKKYNEEFVVKAAIEEVNKIINN
tara:strand:+ start:634 stop:1764 length:1131 start_codon:yes stop_codon:yes gene_type:complete